MKVSTELAATDMIDILGPIKQAWNNFQRDDCYLGVWHELKDKVPTQFQLSLANRLKIGLEDCTLAANILDHRFAGSNLSPVEFTSCKDYLKSLEPTICFDLTQYLAKEAPYTADLFDESYQDVNPVAWWKAGKKLLFGERLSSLAISLTSATGSPLTSNDNFQPSV